MKRSTINALYSKYHRLVYRRARYLLGNDEDAKEATHEVFIRAFRSAERFEQRSELTTWLSRITTHYCLNQIRDRSRRRELWQENSSSDPSGRLGILGPEEMITMRRLLAVAEEKCALAACYVFVEGMSHQEASRILGVSRRTVGYLIEKFQHWAQEYLDDEKKNGDVE